MQSDRTRQPYVAAGREGRAIASPEARPLGTREHRGEVAS